MASRGVVEKATLGGGCFWCLEAVYERLEGVAEVRSGYAGGDVVDPTYEQVCSGATGHAEVVQLEFEPSVTSYREILEVFFAIHDPTALNRQGADVGTQYRSVIFYHSPEQVATAEKLVAELDAAGYWETPIVTQIVPFEAFYAAEDYHHEYYRRNPGQAYCRVVIEPKLTSLRSKFAHKLRSGDST